MFEKLRSIFGFENTASSTGASESIDSRQLVQSIREREQQDKAIGRQILRLDFQQFELMVDREFTGRYRISAFKGQHKVYGFTVSDKEIEDQQFETAWDNILTFLEHPSPAELPRSERFDAHFFGHPE